MCPHAHWQWILFVRFDTPKDTELIIIKERRSRATLRKMHKKTGHTLFQTVDYILIQCVFSPLSVLIIFFFIRHLKFTSFPAFKTMMVWPIGSLLFFLLLLVVLLFRDGAQWNVDTSLDPVFGRLQFFMALHALHQFVFGYSEYICENREKAQELPFIPTKLIAL